MEAASTLRRVRLNAHLSLRELARRANTSHATLAAYEAGRTIPRVDTLDRILRAAGFASDITTSGRADATDADRQSKGRELLQALDLASQFPARHHPDITFPRFPTGTPRVRLDPTGLPYKMRAIHQSLGAARIGHAFGGALALAWCTKQARGTIDLDVNVFVGPERTGSALAALPPQIAATKDDRALLEREGQARLWWENTPVDVFLNTTDFHEQVETRVRLEPFAGEQMPFLACQDLAVFKAFFNRTKDWADLEAMMATGSLDVSAVVGVLAGFLGADDNRIERLLSLSR